MGSPERLTVSKGGKEILKFYLTIEGELKVVLCVIEDVDTLIL